MKLASLFDGIAGFPYAASMLGIEPVWASEIEKFPIAVSKYHFPNMKHYGSVCDIKGSEVEPVDIVTFGSPCQDLSVAGKRAGMGEGTRSGLFSEAVRIIKEMRSVNHLRNTNDVGTECGDGNNASAPSGGSQHGIYSNNGGKDGRYPRFAIWENVPGAFSSNHGEDFRAVIESLAKVAEETVSIPMPKDGKWEPAGLVEGDGWSIAWRTLDAQFWGVPQRRKRIFLVADFGGQCASEIFFERESLLGNTAESGSPREEITGGVEGGVRVASFKWGQGSGSHGIGHAVEQSPTLPSNAGGNTAPAVYPINGMVIGKEIKGDDRQTTGIGEDGMPSPTIRAQGHQHCIACATKQISQNIGIDCALPLAACDYKEPQIICVYATQDPITAENRTHALGANSSQAIMGSGSSITGTLSTAAAHSWSGAQDAFGGEFHVIEQQTVRRLTPTECSRLQGYPDGWCDIEGASDSAKYKALGNSVAIPCVKFILGCIARSYAKMD